MSAALLDARRVGGALGEVKWSKASAKKLPAYQALVDIFFDLPGVCFRALVVDQDQVDLDQYHGGDPERAYWVFYYMLLAKWLLRNNSYTLYLDYKPCPEAGNQRAKLLAKYVGNYLTSRGGSIDGVHVVSSRHSHLSQLADVLTGAVAADANSALKSGSAKEALARHVATRRGQPSASTPTWGSHVSKFNVFRINLRPRSEAAPIA